MPRCEPARPSPTVPVIAQEFRPPPPPALGGRRPSSNRSAPGPRCAPQGQSLGCAPAAAPAGGNGGVAERLKAHAWRACMGATPSRVRIPLPPPPLASGRLRTHPENRSQEGVGARALEFAVLTAARTGEVIGARWDGINLAEQLS